MPVRISVIVLSYNYEDYIKETLNCLMNQSDSDFEIIVVDDGSKDNSCDVINSFISQNNSHIKINLYCHDNHQNKGIIESYKFALSKCNYEYVAFCESDDYWDTDYIKNLKTTIECSKCSFIASKIVCVNQSSNSEYDEYVELCNNRLHRLPNYMGSFFKYLSYGNSLPTFSSVCVKKNVLLSCDYSSIYPPYLDLWLWRQIGIKYCIAFSENSICYWRKHDLSYDMVRHLSDIQFFLIANNSLIINKYVDNKFVKLLVNGAKYILPNSLFMVLQNSLLKFVHKRIMK